MFYLVMMLMAVCHMSWGQLNNESRWLAVQPNSSDFVHTLPFPNSVCKYKFGSRETGGLYTLFEAEYLTDGPGRHIHTREDELFQIIDGKVQFFVNGKQLCGSTGDYVFVPRNTPQTIRVHNINKLKRPVRIQILLAPAGLEGFLDEIAPLYFTGQHNITLQDGFAKKIRNHQFGTC
ncbi:unnamed protein product [Rotaria socialis]|uniref:Cupin type-2 domain-containing protein n=3 Tax=Rotaria socialis TaxID=392032 RepID=A0A817TS34_9BILA|nr:unnamed protein product [Rotaria socialis]